ncbi:MAG: outer membrane protein transport protein [Myxococcales bacterium]|nr:outer membrane protein transport protein [Myxococcales bacterium]
MIPTSAFEPTVSGPQRGFGPRQQAPRTGVGAGEQARRTGPCAPEQARRTRFWSRLCCAVFLALVLVAPSATASTQDIVGFGARGPAMGGVTMASTRDTEAIYYNPAALTRSPLMTVSLGYIYGDSVLRVRGASLTDPAMRASITDAAPVQGLQIGASLLLPLKGWWKGRIALGLGLLMPGKVIVRARLPKPYTPQFPLLGNRGEIVGVQLGLAFRIGWGLSVGVGVNALAGLFGGIDVGENVLGKLGSTVADELLTDFSLLAGVLYQPNAQWSVGIVYRGLSAAQFSLPITVDLGGNFPFKIPTLNITGVAQFDPRQVGGSVAWRPIAPLLVEVGVTWKQWSKFRQPIANTTEGNPPLPALRFHDVVVPRIGVEGEFVFGRHTLTLRGGYVFEKSPVPQQLNRSNFLDNDRHILTFGLGYRYLWGGRLDVRVDFFVQYHHLVSRTHTKDPGDLFAASNLGFPSVGSSGWFLAGGGYVSVGF